jgi:hypothetical protein
VASAKLALDSEQEKLIELRREMVNGTERTVWKIPLRKVVKVENSLS